MITELKIVDHGPIAEAMLRLSRLHAFIGPNDTGKSFALDAIRKHARSKGIRVLTGWDFDGQPDADLITVHAPENGFHPCRLAEIVQIMRRCTNTQFIIETHSPLIVNELTPDEVTVVSRTVILKGREPETRWTKFTPIAQLPHFEVLSKGYALGEYWLSISDGIHA